jgi:hypothetical protein
LPLSSSPSPDATLIIATPNILRHHADFTAFIFAAAATLMPPRTLRHYAMLALPFSRRHDAAPHTRRVYARCLAADSAMPRAMLRFARYMRGAIIAKG